MMVLVVDDNEQNCCQLQALLAGNGYTVVTATNGAEALEKARLIPPDLIVSDILMPVMDGFSLCREWKQDPVLRDIPLIFYTATYTGERDREFALGLGAARFIVKPEEPEHLLRVIQATMAETEQHRWSRQPRTVPDDAVYLKEYNEALIRTLEGKMRQLEQTNQELERSISERRHAEEAFKVEQALLDNLLRTSPDHIYFKNRQSRFVRINAAMAQRFGLSGPNDAVGKSDFDFFTQEHARQAYEDEQRVMSTGEPIIGLEEKETWPDGHVSWVSTTKVPLRDADGNFTGLVGISRDITERKKAEEALRVNERKYRELVENANSIILRWTRDGKIAFLNEFGQKFFGYAEAEILGRHLVGTIVPESNRASGDQRPSIDQISANPKAFEQNVSENMRRNGERVWVAWTNRLVLDEQGQPKEILSIGSDITERRRAETALRREQAFYHSLVEQLPAGVFRKDREGRYVFVSPWFCRLKGMKEEDFLGKTPQEVAASQAAKPGATEQAIKYAAQGTDHHALIQQTGNPIELIEEYTDAAGRKQFIHAIKIPVFDSAGEVIGTQGVLFDVTVRRQAEEALKVEQTLFNSLISTVPDHIYFKDRQSRFVRINNVMAQRFGMRSPDEAVGKTDFDVFREEHARQAYDDEQRIMSSGEPIIGLEEKETWPDGHITWVSSTKVPLRTADGAITGLVGISRDITERKQVEAQFLRAQRLESVGALASGVAHDLNNVLAPIVMGAQLLRPLVESERGKRLLATIEASALRGAGVVKQVLTFTRGIEGERVPLQPRHLLKEMVLIASETFPKNIQVDIDIAPDLWPILGDATQIHQALMNLCVNARDAMPSGGTLTLRATNVTIDEKFKSDNFGPRTWVTPDPKPGPKTLLSVADTGTGIPLEDLAKVFEPFFTTKAPGKGTGLGLSTVLGIVRSHGGFIRIQSEEGKGTRIDLYLPATLKAPVPASEPADPRRLRGQGELILVVDDDAAVREIISKVLKQAGYEVVAATQGNEAVDLFVQQHAAIDAVISDMVMPGMDGPTLVDILRKIDPAVRLMGMSGFAERTGSGAPWDLPLFLTKPFSAEKLLLAVHELLQAPADKPPRG